MLPAERCLNNTAYAPLSLAPIVKNICLFLEVGNVDDVCPQKPDMCHLTFEWNQGTLHSYVQ